MRWDVVGGLSAVHVIDVFVQLERKVEDFEAENNQLTRNSQVVVDENKQLKVGLWRARVYVGNTMFRWLSRTQKEVESLRKLTSVSTQVHDDNALRLERELAQVRERSEEVILFSYRSLSRVWLIDVSLLFPVWCACVRAAVYSLHGTGTGQ